MADDNTQTPPAGTPPAGAPPAGTPPAVPAAAPAFDVDALATQLADGITAKLAGATAPPATPPVTTPPDPIGDMVRPYIEKGDHAAQLAAAMAMDAATFYAGNSEAVEHKDEIEKAAMALARQGVPFTRADVWNWYIGRNFDKIAAARTKRQADAAAAAAAAGHVGPGSPPRGDGQVTDARTLEHDALGKALEGVSF